MHYLFLGLTLGLSAGITPGPLLTLVITAALRRGLTGGLLVALAPFVTDAPIIALSLLLLDRLPPWALTAVTAAGGLLVVYLGVDALRAARRRELPGQIEGNSIGRSELWQGALVNALNPHPYLFWATVGGPTLLAGWREGTAYAAAFLLGFYALLVGSKVIVAWLVARQSRALSPRVYRLALNLLGVAMIALGLLLVRQAWSGGWVAQ
ncbi:MAG: LysE family translocator [Anaerolineae bacterium]|nr:LysE family translocator [Anaerolineae bacterium]